MLRPRAVDDAGFTVVPDPNEPGGFIVRGERPSAGCAQTDFDNDEAVGYLADRLARLGVEAELSRLGAEPGAAITIGDVTFDFEPTAGVGRVGVPRRPGAARTGGSSARGAPAPTIGSSAKKSRRRCDEDGTQVDGRRPGPTAEDADA